MSKSYLQSYLNLIPVTQQQRLLQVIQKSFTDQGIVPARSDINKQLQDIISQLSAPLGSPLIKYREATKYGKVVSRDYNSMMQEIYADLGALFKQDNSVNRTIDLHRQINDTNITDIRSALRSVENKIKVYQILNNSNSGVTDAIFNNFFKDDNQITNSIYKSWYDSDTNSLKLPFGLSLSSLNINGLAMAEITSKNLGGGITAMAEGNAHPISNAIDGNIKTFWAEVILTDEPISQVYDGDLIFGVVCELTISLYRRESINYIKFYPYTSYPLTILKIKYRDNPNDPWIDIGVNSQTSVTAIEFSFNEIFARELMIVINQPNVSVDSFQIPQSMINNSLLWQYIVNREFSLVTEGQSPNQFEQDNIDYIPGWIAYTEAMGNYDDRLNNIGKPSNYLATGSISESIFDAVTQQMLESSDSGAESLKLNLYKKSALSNDKMIEIRKYMYVYGAYDIMVNKIWYLNTGYYISPKYQPNGTVLEAGLDVNDITPSGTTIEYQLSTRDNVWINIMPSGVIPYISKERVDIDPLTLEGHLRFPASGTINALYKDDSLIPDVNNNYIFTQNTYTVALASGWYSPTAFYTTSYVPVGVTSAVPSGVTASFVNDPLIREEEVFTNINTANYNVTLIHYPFIDYRPINDTARAGTIAPHFYYTGGRWLNSSIYNLYGISPGDYYDVMTVTVDGYPAENMTDYYEGIRPALTAYSLSSYPNFDYFHEGKNIYFNVPLSNRTVKIIYDYLNDYVQFRATLRSNLRSIVNLTPTLNDFTIKVKTI